MAEEQDQSAQNEPSESETAPDEAFVAPTRSPITVQTYEFRASREIMRSQRDKRSDTYRPNLPIIYMDRETLERMR